MSYKILRSSITEIMRKNANNFTEYKLMNLIWASRRVIRYLSSYFYTDRACGLKTITSCPLQETNLENRIEILSIELDTVFFNCILITLDPQFYTFLILTLSISMELHFWIIVQIASFFVQHNKLINFLLTIVYQRNVNETL